MLKVASSIVSFCFPDTRIPHRDIRFAEKPPVGSDIMDRIQIQHNNTSSWPLRSEDNPPVGDQPSPPSPLLPAATKMLLLELPTELLSLIFTHLDPYTLLTRGRLVCCRFNTVIMTLNKPIMCRFNPAIWSRIFTHLGHLILTRSTTPYRLANMELLCKAFYYLLQDTQCPVTRKAMFTEQICIEEGFLLPIRRDPAAKLHPFVTNLPPMLFKGTDAEVRACFARFNNLVNHNATSPPTDRIKIEIGTVISHGGKSLYIRPIVISNRRRRYIGSLQSKAEPSSKEMNDTAGKTITLQGQYRNEFFAQRKNRAITIGDIVWGMRRGLQRPLSHMQLLSVRDGVEVPMDGIDDIRMDMSIQDLERPWEYGSTEGDAIIEDYSGMSFARCAFDGTFELRARFGY